MADVGQVLATGGTTIVGVAVGAGLTYWFGALIVTGATRRRGRTTRAGMKRGSRRMQNSRGQWPARFSFLQARAPPWKNATRFEKSLLHC
jgi:hypothetical protein